MKSRRLTRSALAALVVTSALVAGAVATAAPVSAAGDDVAPPPAASDRRSGKPGPTRATPAPEARPAELQRQDLLLPVAKQLDEQARDAGSDIAGVKIDVRTGVVHLFRTDVTQQLRLAELPSGVRVEVHKAAFNRAAMLNTTQAIKRDAKELGQQRVSVQGVGPTVDGSGINVSVLVDQAKSTDQLKAASELLRTRYGAVVGHVTANDRKVSDKDRFNNGPRFNDYAPWYGGDRIHSSTGGCSTGFSAVLNSTTPVMLTAAHCGSAGTAFYNGPRTDGSYSYMGSMVYDNEDTDVAAIEVSSTTNAINVGPAENSWGQLAEITGWASPVAGQVVCQSGSYTGEVCGLQVVDTHQSQCVEWFLWWCIRWQGPFANAINTAGPDQYAVGHGDSGGPVYLPTADQTGIAVGLVSRVLTDSAKANYPDYFPDTRWCPAPEGWMQRCASGFAFAHMPGH